MVFCAQFAVANAKTDWAISEPYLEHHLPAASPLCATGTHQALAVSKLSRTGYGLVAFLIASQSSKFDLDSLPLPCWGAEYFIALSDNEQPVGSGSKPS